MIDSSRTELRGAGTVPTAGETTVWARRMGVLVGGTILGQSMVVAATPILTRLYTPAELGSFFVYLAVMGVLSVVAGGRYELAVPLPSRDADALALLSVAAVLACLVGVALVAAGVSVGAGVARAAGVPGFGDIAWLVGPGVAVTASGAALEQWATRREAFGVLARARITQNAAQAVGQLAVAGLGMGAVGLVLGHVFGRVGAIAVLGRLLWHDIRGLSQPIRLGDLKRVAGRYRRFPLLLAPCGVVNALSLQVPLPILAAAYGPAVAGHIGLARQAVELPARIVGQAAARVYVAEATRLSRAGAPGIRRACLMSIRRLLLLALGPTAVLWLGGPWVFTTLFGAAWEEAGVLARPLAMLGAVGFAVWPAAHTLVVLERERHQAGWDVARFVAVLGALVGAVELGAGHRTAIVVYAAAMAGMYLICAAIALRVAGAWDRATQGPHESGHGVVNEIQAPTATGVAR